MKKNASTCAQDCGKQALSSPPLVDVRVLSRTCGMVKGLLEGIQPPTWGSVIASIRYNCPHCGNHAAVVHITVPDHIEPQIRPLIGEQVGICRLDDEYIVREFPLGSVAAQTPAL